MQKKKSYSPRSFFVSSLSLSLSRSLSFPLMCVSDLLSLTVLNDKLFTMFLRLQVVCTVSHILAVILRKCVLVMF